jgi:hypothetical protein
MKKYQLVVYMFLAILLVATSIWGLEGNPLSRSKKSTVEQTSNQMNDFLLAQNERNAPLTPDIWLSRHARVTSMTEAAAGGISGRVTQASGGAGIENVLVSAYRLDCPYSNGSAYSDGDGYYTIPSLPDGPYEVYTYNDSIFVDLYWDNRPYGGEFDTVMVSGGQITPDIDFALPLGGRITGKVTMPGAGSAGVTVYATDTLSARSHSAFLNTVNDTASYEIKGLPTSGYKLNTYNSQGFADEYYNDKPDEASADLVSVTQGSTTPGIDFTLAVGGKISGTVTMTGAALVQSSVTAVNTTTGDFYSTFAFNVGSSAAYEIEGMPTGMYKVYTFNYLGYVDEYYNDKPDENTADAVSVTLGNTTSGVDFTLNLGGIIKGTITSSAKAPLEDIYMQAFSTASEYIGKSYASTDASGNYRLAGLRTGYYKVLAYGDSVYAWEYLDNKPSWSDADSVMVTEADSVLGKDFVLDVGGAISGFVYGEGAVPVYGADVLAYSNSFILSLARSQTTAGNGSYRIGGLRTGWYRVLATTECDEMWYDNKSIFEIPDSVYVTMPATTSGVNFNFPSAVAEEEGQVNSRPIGFELGQNYPNPFNPTTAIAYMLRKKALVKLEIYNLLGQRVKTLADDYQSPGSYRILWDGKNQQGETVASGMYFYKLDVDGVSRTKRMVLMK